MNIKITHSWLLEYLETDATPEEIQKYLSLCGPSIERIEKVGEEIVYDIEITSNRIDTASVLGIAREASAILPQFGKIAKLIKKNLEAPIMKSSSIPIEIIDPDGLCKRVLGIVLDISKVSESPKYISDRLTATDMRSLNNIVDITNYIMTEIGHPTHVFDYDRIVSHKLILRHAKKGEEIITLDEKKYHLDNTDIIIDDGTGTVIDLPGIMGTANSVVTKNTKRILLFIESNDPVSIRRTSMRYGIRTMASTINEKGPDSELAYTALLRGIELYRDIAQAHPLSSIIDIYPIKAKNKTIQTSTSFINAKVGVEIPFETITSILTHLDFKVDSKDKKYLEITVPTHRIGDVSIPEDIVEEVARVYGYHTIPSVLQNPAYVSQPKDMDLLFHYQYEVKSYLKHKGYMEVMNYSGVSLELLKQFEIDKKEYIYITNSISEDIKFLRQSLIPSLIKNVKQNDGFTSQMKFFELAKTYIPTDSLPREDYMLCICTTVSLSELQSILIGLMKELNIAYELSQSTGDGVFLLGSAAGELIIKDKSVGIFGQVKPALCRNGGLEKPVFVAELSFKDLINAACVMPSFKSFSQYAHISNDITIKKKAPFSELKKKAFTTSQRLVSFSPISIYKDTITLRLGFTDRIKNISESEVKKEVEKIQSTLTNTK